MKSFELVNLLDNLIDYSNEQRADAIREGMETYHLPPELKTTKLTKVMDVENLWMTVQEEAENGLIVRTEPKGGIFLVTVVKLKVRELK